MKVILQQDLAKVGREGEIVTVADGFARNYLLPRHLAVVATGGALKAHQARQAALERKAEQIKTEAEQAAAVLNEKSVRLVVKVGASDRLYGSITAQDIADAIKAQHNVTVDRRKVQLIDAIKSLGSYTVPVKLHRDITITLGVEVTKA